FYFLNFILLFFPVVTCHSGHSRSPEEMDLRLNGTGDRCSGWLEVLHAATWKRIDSRNFTQQNAELACRQLGCHLPFGILQPYVEDSEKHETCLMTCQRNETALKDCIACDSHDFVSLGVFLVCQDRPRTKIEEGTSLCLGTLESDVEGYKKMLCLSLQRWWDKLVHPGHKDQNRERSLHHWEKLQCEKRNLSVGNCSGNTQECLSLTLVRCSGQVLKSQKSSSETVLGILLGLVLIAVLLIICALPTYKKIMKKFSFHRKSSTAFQTHLENPVVQEEGNKASQKTYLSPYAALEGATNRSSSPLDNSSDSDYDLYSAQQL
ncbi:hypothetical protein E2320_020649, partial [Naja naja]